MKKLILTIYLMIPLLSNTVFSQTAKPSETLTFHVTGFENNTGQALVFLFKEGDNVPTKPSVTLKAAIVNNTADLSAGNLPYGEYAAIVVHDLNGNGMIDHKWGFPAEPLGYTNNWKLSMFSGMPTFEKLKFNFSKSTCTITIKMNE